MDAYLAIVSKREVREYAPEPIPPVVERPSPSQPAGRAPGRRVDERTEQ